MDDRTLRVLEFTKVRDMLADCAASELGKALCRALEPTAVYAQVEALLGETEEAVVISARIGQNPIPAFDDSEASLRKAKIGSILSPRELLLCAGLMRAARSVKTSLGGQEGVPSLRARSDSLVTMRMLEEDIQGAIIGEEEIADSASPELYAVRRKIRQSADRIRDKLNGLLHSQTFQKYLQEPLITMRNGRYVLPIKQEHRQSVPGLIHDQSGSGATLFIEPMAVVEINNDLKQLLAQEAAEIERILAALTARVAPDADALINNQGLLAQLDAVFAKASLARSMRAVCPQLVKEQRLHIKRARHPLIDPAVVVPIDLWLGGDFSTLVVTGPNTGGKTVTLKTAGLFALMTQAGLHIPAELGTYMCVFDDVFADIGDEQSIEQSLSTFSSHMINIVRILGRVTPRSLVLFDELGAGTDPTEGAALAMSILDDMRGRSARVVATTHYAELKAYALSTEGVENASVEFNVETLRPTYRLSIGIPGRSNAFEISRRLGLPGELIERATERISSEKLRFEDVISSAESSRQIADRERKLAEEASMEIVRLRDEIERRRAELEEQKTTLMRKARDDARRVVRQAQEEAERIIRELKTAQLDAADQARLIQKSREALKSGLDGLADGLVVNDAPRLTPPPENLKPGETVDILHLNTKGTVISGPNERGEVQVQAGLIKITAQVEQLRRAQEKQSVRERARSQIDMKTRVAALELDVRGQTLDEASDNLDKYLDDAFLTGLHEVFVIHGKGTGALRAGLQQHMKRHPHVEAFRLGKFGEGEDGVTIVTLK